MLKKIAATLFFSAALIFAFIFFLLNGIKINSFSLGQIYISQLYIKLNKKLIVEIDKIHLGIDSKVENSSDDIETNIRRVPTLLKFFERIDVKALNIDGNKIKILFNDDRLEIDNKFVTFASQYKEQGDILNFEIDKFYLKDIKLSLDGNINIDYVKTQANYLGKYIFKDNVRGDIHFKVDKHEADFFLTTNKVKNLKFLKSFMSLDKIAEAWLYDNVTGDMQLDYLLGKINMNTYEPILGSFKGEATVKNAAITFNKKVAPVKSPLLKMRYGDDTLKFDLQDPKYQKLSIEGSKVEILNMTSQAKGRVDVLIKTKELLNDHILDILRAYNLNLPIKQTSGQTDAHILLKIPYQGALETYGNFDLKNSEFLINNSFPFYSKQANVELKKSKVIIRSSNFQMKDLLDSTVDLTIDIKKSNGSGTAKIKSFKIENNKNEVINLKNVETPFAIYFKDKTIIDIKKFATKIVPNKEYTEVNIDKLQPLSKYSNILKENKLTNGRLNLKIIDDNNIKFEGFVKGINVPVKKDGKNITSMNFDGQLKDKNLKIISKQKDIRIDIQPKKLLKITLRDMDIHPGENKGEPLKENINVRLIESRVHVEDEIYYPKDVTALIEPKKVSFDGIVHKLAWPLSVNGKKAESLDLKGVVVDDKIEVQSKDKKLFVEVREKVNYFIKLNKMDVHYNTKDKGTTGGKNIHIIGKNANIIINDKYKALASKYDFRINSKIERFELAHNDTTMNYLKDEKDIITISAKNVSDQFINAFFDKEFVKGGTLNVEATGEKDIISGRIDFKDNKFTNLTTLNNVIILVNTSPGLVNPFLAIPSVFGMVTSDGFNVNGYRVNSGYVDFTYNAANKFLNMYTINTVGNSVDFDGYATFDFEKNIVHSDVKLIFLKGYSSFIDAIPGLDYILLGDDKKISTLVNIRGDIDNPDIKTNVLKDSASAPFGVIKRILTLPFKPFM